MSTASGPEPTPNNELHVIIEREMWSEFFMLTLDSGHTEELDVEQTRDWFKVRGANMDKIEKVLDHCWNFGRSEAIIENPKAPPVSRLPYSPDI